MLKEAVLSVVVEGNAGASTSAPGPEARKPRFRLQTQFEHLTLAAKNKIPGFSNMSGYIDTTLDEGIVEIYIEIWRDQLYRFFQRFISLVRS